MRDSNERHGRMTRRRLGAALIGAAAWLAGCGTGGPHLTATAAETAADVPSVEAAGDRMTAERAVRVGPTLVRPEPAVRAGYTLLTFDYGPTSPLPGASATGTVDRLFAWNWFGMRAAPSPVRRDASGDLVLTGTAPQNSQLVSARQTALGSWEGFVFGNGGYFEAELAFDPQRVDVSGRTGWPAFWTLSWEHLTDSPASEWPGQPRGYERFIEVDVMEYLLRSSSPDGLLYGGNIHDWYGVWGQSCAGPSPRHCSQSLSFQDIQRRAPAGTDFTRFQRFGALWVPATASRDGYLEWYLNGQRIGRSVTWKPWSAAARPTDAPERWRYSIIDRHHLALIVGTGLGTELKVRRIQVWQGPQGRILRR